MPSRRRPANHGMLRVIGARAHNLQDLTVDFPLGVLCVVTGVSGAGKSTLVAETLYPALCRIKHKKVPEGAAGADTEVRGAGQVGDVVHMDQAPLTRSSRSNPVTYVKAFDDIRQLFAETTEARVRNWCTLRTLGSVVISSTTRRRDSSASSRSINSVDEARNTPIAPHTSHAATIRPAKASGMEPPMSALAPMPATAIRLEARSAA